MEALNALIETVAKLRDPNGGCPWDIEQTHQSLADCLIEEAAEVLETIDRLDMEHMREELGDLLLQVVMHAQMAREAGHFDFAAVAAEINEKLVRRHPHVFGDQSGMDTEAVLKQWDAIKATEKKRGPAQGESRFKSLPNRLPALLYARGVFKQIQKAGMDTEAVLDTASLAGLAEQLDSERAAGRKLFEIVAACRMNGIDPESALRRYADEAVKILDGDGV